MTGQRWKLAVVPDGALDRPAAAEAGTEGLHLPAVLHAVALVVAADPALVVPGPAEVGLRESHALRGSAILPLDLVGADLGVRRRNRGSVTCHAHLCDKLEGSFSAVSKPFEQLPVARTFTIRVYHHYKYCQ